MIDFAETQVTSGDAFTINSAIATAGVWKTDHLEQIYLDISIFLIMDIYIDMYVYISGCEFRTQIYIILHLSCNIYVFVMISDGYKLRHFGICSNYYRYA